jgi:hypothetical protein
MVATARLFAILCTALLLIAAPAQAQVLSVETWIEEWDPARQQWVRVGAEDAPPGAGRLVAARAKPQTQAIAIYGPFRVVDQTHAEMIGVTDRQSPAQFQAMLRDFPQLRELALVECPGTDHDIANLAVGRMIRAAGLATHVPAHGSVRSGAVELFLAGESRRIDDGAEFAVHSWRDTRGREADDFGADEGANATYLAYYREMGMSTRQARAFYDMTNSVPHADARWLTAQDMRGWIGEAPVEGIVTAAPKIAYADTGYLDSALVLP